MNLRSRVIRWIMLAFSAGLMPAFVMRCDKAALNLQRGFFWGLGEDVGDFVLSQFGGIVDENN